MNIPAHWPRLKGVHYPRDVIFYAVWAFYSFVLSSADVEAAQRFLSAHDPINLIFRPRRYQITTTSYRKARNDARGAIAPSKWRIKAN